MYSRPARVNTKKIQRGRGKDKFKNEREFVPCFFFFKMRRRVHMINFKLTWCDTKAAKVRSFRRYPSLHRRCCLMQTLPTAISLVCTIILFITWYGGADFNSQLQNHLACIEGTENSNKGISNFKINWKLCFLKLASPLTYEIHTYAHVQGQFILAWTS